MTADGKRNDWLWSLVILAVVAVTLTVMVVQGNDCEQRGGKYVRGVAWYECVEAKR